MVERILESQPVTGILHEDSTADDETLHPAFFARFGVLDVPFSTLTRSAGPHSLGLVVANPTGDVTSPPWWRDLMKNAG
jgi:hypothetical protein